jgi:hypothetical protein
VVEDDWGARPSLSTILTIIAAILRFGFMVLWRSEHRPTEWTWGSWSRQREPAGSLGVRQDPPKPREFARRRGAGIAVISADGG